MDEIPLPSDGPDQPTDGQIDQLPENAEFIVFEQNEDDVSQEGITVEEVYYFPEDSLPGDADSNVDENSLIQMTENTSRYITAESSCSNEPHYVNEPGDGNESSNMSPSGNYYFANEISTDKDGTQSYSTNNDVQEETVCSYSADVDDAMDTAPSPEPEPTANIPSEVANASETEAQTSVPSQVPCEQPQVTSGGEANVVVVSETSTTVANVESQQQPPPQPLPSEPPAAAVVQQTPVTNETNIVSDMQIDNNDSYAIQAAATMAPGAAPVANTAMAAAVAAPVVADPNQVPYSAANYMAYQQMGDPSMMQYYNMTANSYNDYMSMYQSGRMAQTYANPYNPYQNYNYSYQMQSMYNGRGMYTPGAYQQMMPTTNAIPPMGSSMTNFTPPLPNAYTAPAFSSEPPKAKKKEKRREESKEINVNILPENEMPPLPEDALPPPEKPAAEVAEVEKKIEEPVAESNTTVAEDDASAVAEPAEASAEDQPKADEPDESGGDNNTSAEDVNRYSPSLAMDEEDRDQASATATTTPTADDSQAKMQQKVSSVLDKAQAKKRLMAFSISKQTTAAIAAKNKPSTGGGKRENGDANSSSKGGYGDETNEHGVNSGNVFDDKHSKKKAKKSYKVEKARETIEEIEEIKRSELSTMYRSSLIRDTTTYDNQNLDTSRKGGDSEDRRRDRKRGRSHSRSRSRRRSYSRDRKSRRSDRKHRRRSRSRSRSRSTHRSHSRSSSLTTDKKPKVKTSDIKNWDDFSEAGFQLDRYRRIKYKENEKQLISEVERRKQEMAKSKVRGSRFEDRRSASIEKEIYEENRTKKLNMLESPVELKQAVVTMLDRGKQEETIEFPSHIIQFTNTKPVLKFCENLRYAKRHFMNREQLMDTVPDDVADLIKRFLTSPKAKRLKPKSSTDAESRLRSWWLRSPLAEGEQYVEDEVEDDEESSLYGPYQAAKNDDTSFAHTGERSPIFKSFERPDGGVRKSRFDNAVENTASGVDVVVRSRWDSDFEDSPNRAADAKAPFVERESPVAASNHVPKETVPPMLPALPPALDEGGRKRRRHDEDESEKPAKKSKEKKHDKRDKKSKKSPKGSPQEYWRSISESKDDKPSNDQSQTEKNDPKLQSEYEEFFNSLPASYQQPKDDGGGAPLYEGPKPPPQFNDRTPAAEPTTKESSKDRNAAYASSEEEKTTKMDVAEEEEFDVDRYFAKEKEKKMKKLSKQNEESKKSVEEAADEPAPDAESTKHASSKKKRDKNDKRKKKKKIAVKTKKLKKKHRKTKKKKKYESSSNSSSEGSDESESESSSTDESSSASESSSSSSSSSSGGSSSSALRKKRGKGKDKKTKKKDKKKERKHGDKAKKKKKKKTQRAEGSDSDEKKKKRKTKDHDKKKKSKKAATADKLAEVAPSAASEVAATTKKPETEEQPPSVSKKQAKEKHKKRKKKSDKEKKSKDGGGGDASDGGGSSRKRKKTKSKKKTAASSDSDATEARAQPGLKKNIIDPKEIEENVAKARMNNQFFEDHLNDWDGLADSAATSAVADERPMRDGSSIADALDYATMKNSKDYRKTNKKRAAGDDRSSSSKEESLFAAYEKSPKTANKPRGGLYDDEEEQPRSSSPPAPSEARPREFAPLYSPTDDCAQDAPNNDGDVLRENRERISFSSRRRVSRFSSNVTSIFAEHSGDDDDDDENRAAPVPAPVPPPVVKPAGMPRTPPGSPSDANYSKSITPPDDEPPCKSFSVRTKAAKKFVHSNIFESFDDRPPSDQQQQQQQQQPHEQPYHDQMNAPEECRPQETTGGSGGGGHHVPPDEDEREDFEARPCIALPEPGVPARTTRSRSPRPPSEARPRTPCRRSSSRDRDRERDRDRDRDRDRERDYRDRGSRSTRRRSHSRDRHRKYRRGGDRYDHRRPPYRKRGGRSRSRSWSRGRRSSPRDRDGRYRHRGRRSYSKSETPERKRRERTPPEPEQTKDRMYDDYARYSRSPRPPSPAAAAADDGGPNSGRGGAGDAVDAETQSHMHQLTDMFEYMMKQGYQLDGMDFNAFASIMHSAGMLEGGAMDMPKMMSLFHMMRSRIQPADSSMVRDVNDDGSGVGAYPTAVKTKKSVADSTNGGFQNRFEERSREISPKPLSLDERLERELGVKRTPPVRPPVAVPNQPPPIGLNPYYPMGMPNFSTPPPNIRGYPPQAMMAAAANPGYYAAMQAAAASMNWNSAHAFMGQAAPQQGPGGGAPTTPRMMGQPVAAAASTPRMMAPTVTTTPRMQPPPVIATRPPPQQPPQTVVQPNDTKPPQYRVPESIGSKGSHSISVGNLVHIVPTTELQTPVSSQAKILPPQVPASSSVAASLPMSKLTNPSSTVTIPPPSASTNYASILDLPVSFAAAPAVSGSKSSSKNETFGKSATKQLAAGTPDADKKKSRLTKEKRKELKSKAEGDEHNNLVEEMEDIDEPRLPISIKPSPDQGILISPGFKDKSTPVTPLGRSIIGSARKMVSFVDGVRPGASKGDESPPTKARKSPPVVPTKKKHKVRVKIVRPDDSDDDDSPPPPPPGPPPPDLYAPPMNIVNALAAHGYMLPKI